MLAPVFVATAANAQQAAPPPAKPDTPPSTTVVVTARTPPVVHKIDRSVYDLKNIPQAQTGTLSDVLNTLPSVAVMPDGSVTVRGGSVQILIDGKPSAALRGANLATTLQTMPANTIDKIEVITNPGAEFRTNAATVINIVTKKVRSQKPTGNLMVKTADRAGRNSLNLSGSAGIGKWTFNGALAATQDLHDWTYGFDRTALDPADGSVLSHMVANQGYVSHYRADSLDGGATYAATDRDSLTLGGHVSTFQMNRWLDNTIVFLDPSGNAVSDPTILSHGPFTFDDASATGTWKHQGKRDGETFTLVARHEEAEIIDDQTNAQDQDLPVASSQAYLTARNERQLTDQVSADYVLPLGTDTQFKAGFDIENDQDQSYNLAANIDPASGAETPNPLLTSRFLSDQVLSAVYADYQRPLGKWLVEGGLRVENLKTTLGTSRGALAAAAPDLEWSPSLFLSRELTAHQKIKFTYSRRVDRPNPLQLNRAPLQMDAEDIAIGNPSLRPAKTDSFEAGYDYTTRPVTFSGTAYVRQTHDAITQYSYYTDPDDTALVTTFENAGDASRDGLDLSLDLHPSPKVAYSLNDDIYRAEQTAPVDGAPMRESVVSQTIKASVTLTPTAADQFQISDMMFGAGLTANGRTTSGDSLNLAYTRTLSGRLKLVATVNNMLNTVHYYVFERSPSLISETHWRPHDDTLYVGLTYKLGALPPH